MSWLGKLARTRWKGAVPLVVLASGALGFAYWNLERRRPVDSFLEADFQRFAAAAREEAPEIAADMLLRLAASDPIPVDSSAASLIEESHRLAGASKYRLPLLVGVSSGPVDTREHRTSRALTHLRLDTSSLQRRAVEAMLAVDTNRARRLFENRQAHTVDAATPCESPLVPDPSGADDTLRLLRDAMHSELRGAKDTGAADLARLDPVTSPFAIGARARLLAESEIADSDFPKLLAAFEHDLQSLQSSDRTFSTAIRWKPFVKEIQVLQEACARRGLSTRQLAATVSAYLNRHFQQIRCLDTANSDIQKRLDEETLAAWNRTAALRHQVAMPDEIRTVRDTEAGPIELRLLHPLWGNDTSRRLLNELKHLRFTHSSQSATANWREKFKDIASALDRKDNYDPSSPENHFFETSALFRALVELAPTPELRRDMLRSHARHLASSSLRTTSAPEWLMEVVRFVSPVHEQSEKGELIQSVIGELDDPAILFYATTRTVSYPKPGRK